MNFERMSGSYERPQIRTETSEYEEYRDPILLAGEKFEDLSTEEITERMQAWNNDTLKELLAKKEEQRRIEFEKREKEHEKRTEETRKSLLELEKKQREILEKIRRKYESEQREIRREQEIEEKVVNHEFVNAPDGKVISIQERKTEQMIREAPSTESIMQDPTDLPITNSNASGTIISNVTPFQEGKSTQSLPSTEPLISELDEEEVLDTQQSNKNTDISNIEFVDLAQIELFKDVEDEELVYEMEDEKGVYVVYQLKNGQYYDTYVPNEIESIDLKEYATKSYQFRNHTDIENFTFDIIKGLKYYYNMRETFRKNCYYDEMSDEQLDQLDNYIDDINKVVKAKLEMAAKLAPAWYHGRTPAIPNFYYRGANPYNMHGVDHKYDYLLTPEEKERFPLMRDIQFSIASSLKPVELSEDQIIQIQHGNIIDKKRQEFRVEYSKSIEDNVGISDENNDYEEPMSKTEESTKESDVSEKKKEEQKKMSEEKEMYITMQELAKQNKDLRAENERLRMMLAKYQNVDIQNTSYENENPEHQIGM